ncbi:uncharacterized protein F4822DRAFT_237910 [Hypoxylon trugodes]|uniref:uncharacterized protein n=1 Tax=Hypoxylon trugodes TaxID=326681 RepID=UPI002192094E|nr:uncharacterized protein F4822DRAFT_237910 [Hypoxylon trugodes]KAI1388193.1 hypothetical protein F4822DRAFT_237910 [Hypoxylon trugodes]
MCGFQAGGAAVCLFLAGQTALASPTHYRRAACADLSTETPIWRISNAASSDWPGGGGGRVELWANHIPTGEVADCDVEYRMNATDGSIVGYDPTTVITCTNFGTAALNTTVQLDMETLLLTINSTWACEEGGEAKYSATGSTTLNRDTSPEACLVEPTQVGPSTTCPIADAEVEGKLEE